MILTLVRRLAGIAMSMLSLVCLFILLVAAFDDKPRASDLSVSGEIFAVCIFAIFAVLLAWGAWTLLRRRTPRPQVDGKRSSRAATYRELESVRRNLEPRLSRSRQPPFAVYNAHRSPARRIVFGAGYWLGLPLLVGLSNAAVMRQDRYSDIYASVASTRSTSVSGLLDYDTSKHRALAIKTLDGWIGVRCSTLIQSSNCVPPHFRLPQMVVLDYVPYRKFKIITEIRSPSGYEVMPREKQLRDLRSLSIEVRKMGILPYIVIGALVIWFIEITLLVIGYMNRQYAAARLDNTRR